MRFRPVRCGVAVLTLTFNLAVVWHGSADAGAVPPDPVPPSTEPTEGPSTSQQPEQLQVPQGAFPETRSSTGKVDVFAFLNSVIQHADQLVWVPYFARLGLEEPMVDVKIVGTREYPTFTSACDLNADGQPNDVVLPNTPNAWYCSADGGAWKGALILPAKTLENMWNGDVLGNVSQHPGDVAAAAVVAHEFGHHVADELATQARVGPPAPKGPELLADCLAGLWAYAANQDGYLEPGDVEEAIAAMVALGVNGATSDSHGTGEERRRAFLVGWGAQRVPYVCMAEYWPAMATWLANR